MKKILLYASALAVMMCAESCRKEVSTAAKDGESMVSVSLLFPEGMQTKAIGLAENTDVIYYEIYNESAATCLYKGEITEITDHRQASLDISLANHQTYRFVFWAQNKDCGAYDVTDLLKVEVDYDVIGADTENKDIFDAFFAVEDVEVKGPVSKTITLYRPFAQLNFGASKMETIFGDVEVKTSTVTVSSLATTFNTVKGVGEASRNNVVFTKTGHATEAEMLNTNNASYTWVTMDYMLMPDNASTVEVSVSFDLGFDSPVEHTVSNVPLKENCRTNVVGDLFTSDAQLTIVIEPDFNRPDEVVVINESLSSEAEL